MNKHNLIVAIILYLSLVVFATVVASTVNKEPEKQMVSTVLVREGFSNAQIDSIIDLPIFPAIDKDAVIGKQLWVSPDYRKAIVLNFDKEKCCLVRILYDYTGGKQ